MKTNVKKYIPLYIFVFLAFVVLTVSSVLTGTKGYGKRRVFIFPSVEKGKYVLETRYLKKNDFRSEVTYFLDELVLGSGLERTKYLFTPGTKVDCCIEDGESLYVYLTDDLINMGDKVVEISEGIDLLKKNVVKNFPAFKDVKIFVDGKSAFEF